MAGTDRAALTTGQLLEQAIERHDDAAVAGLLQDERIDINQPCDPARHGSVSPLATALRADNARAVASIAAQPRFDLIESLPAFETWSWVRTASSEVLRQFLGISGVDVNRQDGNGKTLLHEVVYDKASTEKLTDLLYRADIAIDIPQSDGTTPLYRAALAGNARAVEMLLDRGADINNRNHDNRWTVLMCAAAGNHVDVVALLVGRTALDVNAADDIADTALHIATERSFSRVVELLLGRADIDVNRRNHRGWTPLMKAAFAGDAASVRALLERPGIEVNFVDQDRQTALFHAVSAGRLDVVQILLADPRTNAAISNHPDRLTARDMAVALNFTAAAELLEDRDGDSDELSPNDAYVVRTVEPTPASVIRPHRTRH